MTSARNFLVRGLLAGIVAGLVAFGVAYLVGEPSVNASIAIEESGGAAHDHAVITDDHAAESSTSDEPAATEVPRSLQSTAGLLTATLVAGVTLGGLVGVISALALGRLGGLGVRGVTFSLPRSASSASSLLPYLAYPPNPPAVGHPDTIGMRSALYFIMVAISIIAAAHRSVGRAQARESMGRLVRNARRHRRLPLVTVTAIALLPTYNEVPADFPATVLVPVPERQV